MNNLSKIFSILIAFGIFFFNSCKKEDVPPAKFYYNYFPDNVGHWVEYDVTLIEVDEPSQLYDTTRYLLREVIESTFIDNQGRPSLRIERYWRTSDTLPWTVKDVWYATRTTTQAERIEENIRLLKLVFPVKDNKKWDGNIYNTNSEQEYKLDSVHQSLTVNSIYFDSTATVIQSDNSSQIDIDEAWEVYATDVGLIQKEIIDYYLDYVWNPLSQQYEIKYNGYEYHQIVTGYGN